MAKNQFPSPRPDKFKYMNGWGNEHQTEAVEGTLPIGQNSPQICPEGLYAEQYSGTPFTLPRSENRRTWYYRTLPSVAHTKFTKLEEPTKLTSDDFIVNPNQMRWSPPEIKPNVDFTQGFIPMVGAGSAEMKSGCIIYYFTATLSMVDKAFYNSDGEMLIVAQQGRLEIRTECGMIEVFPGEICVIPRGHMFSVAVDGPTRGYVCEVYESYFHLPNLGVIGANCLANARDFKYPVANFEDRKCNYTIVNKFLGNFFKATKDHSPFNVVAWHGNLAPYKYDLDYFCTLNSVSFDHPDPSIYTVLTAPTAVPGMAACDFVIFPPRWEVKDHTFRPPYFHRNCMSEYMGLIRGEYEAKVDGGFVPGGSTLHSCMTPHGPDAVAFEKHSHNDLAPFKLPDTMAFMFETCYLLKLSQYANTHFQENYIDVWSGLKKQFNQNKDQK